MSAVAFITVYLNLLNDIRSEVSKTKLKMSFGTEIHLRMRNVLIEITEMALQLSAESVK